LVALVGLDVGPQKLSEEPVVDDCHRAVFDQSDQPAFVAIVQEASGDAWLVLDVDVGPLEDIDDLGNEGFLVRSETGAVLAAVDGVVVLGHGRWRGGPYPQGWAERAWRNWPALPLPPRCSHASPSVDYPGVHFRGG